MMDIKARLP